MANAAGMIYECIWRDPDWRSLSRSAQALYMQLLSQKELDCAGVLPLHVAKWAKGCDGLTVEQLNDDLLELHEARFVVMDVDTDEVLIRTYIRNSNVMKVPNMRKSARRAAALVGSKAIRAVLAAELIATGDPECILAAEQIHPTPHPQQPVSKQLPEPLRNPSVTLPEGSGVGVGVGVTHLGSNSSGERRPECPKHPDGNSEEENCRRCMKRRQWDEDHAADELAAKRREREALIEAIQRCPDCHGTNTIMVGDDSAAICNHPQVRHG